MGSQKFMPLERKLIKAGIRFEAIFRKELGYRQNLLIDEVLEMGVFNLEFIVMSDTQGSYYALDHSSRSYSRGTPSTLERSKLVPRCLEAVIFVITKSAGHCYSFLPFALV
jgi:hypothetical protein